jgi:tRNA(His) 5'-end guanylyltransferase
MRVVIAMMCTAQDLIAKYNAIAAYTHSDELCVVFVPKRMRKSDDFPVLPFGGRLQKLVSLIAAYTSVRFNYHLEKLFKDKTYHIPYRDLTQEIPLEQSIEFGVAHFDCRCIQFPNVEEIRNYLLWRSHDAYRNAISKCVRQFYTHEDIHKKSTEERVAMINKRNPDYLSGIHEFVFHGAFVKQEMMISAPSILKMDGVEIFKK